MGGRARIFRVLTALTIAAIITPASGAESASTTEQAQLTAIVSADGSDTAASPIVTTSQGDTALIMHALNPAGFAGTHSVADVYTYSSAGSWQRVARVDFGADSSGPNTYRPPQQEHLTGATDFLVGFAAADAEPVSVVSDAGGSWRVVPFAKGGQSATVKLYASVSGTRIRTGVDDCTPDCATGKITFTTWAYDAAGKDFVPATTPPRTTSSSWRAHLPDLAQMAGVTFYQNSDPIWMPVLPQSSSKPAWWIPEYMYQGRSWASFHANGGGYDEWDFCDVDQHGDNASTYACPDLRKASDPALQQLLAASYPGATGTVWLGKDFGGYVAARLGDGSVAEHLGYDMYVGNWTGSSSAAAAVDDDLLGLMSTLQTYVHDHLASWGGCPHAYNPGANINLRIACVVYWQDEGFNDLYQEVTTAWQSATAYALAVAPPPGSVTYKATVAAAASQTISWIAIDDDHDLKDINPPSQDDDRNWHVWLALPSPPSPCGMSLKAIADGLAIAAAVTAGNSTYPRLEDFPDFTPKLPSDDWPDQLSNAAANFLPSQPDCTFKLRNTTS